MGSLKLPNSGKVYVDSNCVIYGVEKVKPYAAILEPLWRAGASHPISLIGSQIVLLEVLVKPVWENKPELQEKFRHFLLRSQEFSTIPIDLGILERAARIRADSGLRTPDAIHAATALEAGAALFVTNDPGFRRVTGMPVAVLSELLDGA